MRNLIAFLSSLILVLFVSCSVETATDEPALLEDKENDLPITPSGNDYYKLCKGADISWLTEMEEQGILFYPKTGDLPEDCLVILKNLGVNAVRLRVWVDPPNKYNTIPDVIAKCKRAKALGMDIMIDFHYSDNWADPGQQTIPSRWEGMNLDQLISALKEYTVESLTRIKAEGIDVKWMQVGNETTNGMLWPIGQANINPKNYALLTDAGYEAVKTVYPDAKVIVHIDGAQNTETAKWIFNILHTYKARFDVAGFSLYPPSGEWEQYLEKARETMLYMVDRYDKEVMLCEVGMLWTLSTQCYNFLKGCFEMRNEIPNDRYLGALYWEPQCFKGWNGYDKGAFNTSHRPTKALDAYSLDYTGVPKIRE